MPRSFQKKDGCLERSSRQLVLAGTILISLVVSSPLTAFSVADQPITESAESSDELTPAAVAEVSDDMSLQINHSKGSQSPETHPLSVEPLGQLLPKDHPAWISAEPDLESTTHRFVVQSIPASQVSEAETNLNAPLEEAMRGYLERLLGDSKAGELLKHKVDATFIRRNLLEESNGYVAELQTSVGPMYQKWVMVEVTDKQQEQFRLWYIQDRQRQRATPLGIAVTGIFILIATAHLALRLRSQRVAKTAPLVVHREQNSEPPVALAAPGPHNNQPFGKKHCCKGKSGVLLAIAVAVLIAISASTASSLQIGKNSKQRPWKTSVEQTSRAADSADNQMASRTKRSKQKRE